MGAETELDPVGLPTSAAPQWQENDSNEAVPHCQDVLETTALHVSSGPADEHLKQDAQVAKGSNEGEYRGAHIARPGDSAYTHVQVGRALGATTTVAGANRPEEPIQEDSAPWIKRKGSASFNAYAQELAQCLSPLALQGKGLSSMPGSPCVPPPAREQASMLPFMGHAATAPSSPQGMQLFMEMDDSPWEDFPDHQQLDGRVSSSVGRGRVLGDVFRDVSVL